MLQRRPELADKIHVMTATTESSSSTCENRFGWAGTDYNVANVVRDHKNKVYMWRKTKPQIMVIDTHRKLIGSPVWTAMYSSQSEPAKQQIEDLIDEALGDAPLISPPPPPPPVVKNSPPPSMPPMAPPDEGACGFDSDCTGDVNGDLYVDSADILQLLSMYNCEGTDCGVVDLNCDKKVDAADVLAIISNFNRDCRA